MGFYAYAQSPVTLYFTNNTYGTNIWKMSATSPSGADSTTIASNAASTTGWYHLDPGLTDSSADASEPSTTHPGWNTVWVSEGSYNGSFASGNWVFTIRKTDSRSNRTGYFHADIYKSSSATDQTGATFIGHCSDASDDWTGGAATIAATCSIASSQTFTDQYIVIRTLNQVATGSTSSGTWTMIIKDATNGLSKLVTPNFTQARQDVSRTPASQTVNLACSISIALCQDTTTSFSQPTLSFATSVNNLRLGRNKTDTASLNFSTSVGTQRTLHVFASTSLNFNSGNPSGTKGMVGGTDYPKSASGSLNFVCTSCTDLQRNFLEPFLEFRTQANAIKNSGAGITRTVNATLTFATGTCIDRSQNALAMGVAITTKATYCLERSFPGTTLTLAVSASAVSSSAPKTRSDSASLNLATSAVVNRVLQKTADATMNLASNDVQLVSRPRSDNATLGLSASVGTLIAKNRVDNASLNFATTLARLRNVSRSDSASVTLTTSIVTQRVMHVTASASIHVNSGAPGVVRSTTLFPWFRGASALITATTSVATQRAMHVLGSTSVTLTTSDSRLAARNRLDSSSLNLIPNANVQRELHIVSASAIDLKVTVTAEITHTARRRVMLIGAM